MRRPRCRTRRRGLLRSLVGPLRDRSFRKYLGFTFFLILGTGFVGQYVWLYAFDVVKWSNQRANFLITVVPLLAGALTYPMWGRMCDRLGQKPVLLIAGSAAVFGPVGWLFIGPDGWVFGYVLVLVVTVMWPGVEIANFNILLGLAGKREEGGEEEGEGGDGSGYVAVNSVVTAVAGVLSGLIGAGFAKWFYRFEWSLAGLAVLPGVGEQLVLTYHGLLFLFGVALRAAAVLWAVRIEEPTATGTRMALRHITTTLYSNVQQGLLLPTRVVGRVQRFAFRMGR